MHVVCAGTGGAAGWPEPGCPCASCARAARDGSRGPSGIVVDGRLRLTMGAGPDPIPGGYLVSEIPGGWEVTVQGGERLIYPAGPGSVLAPPASAAPYDVAFVDLLGDPFQLGRLRADGLITSRTVVLAAAADHRASSAADLRGRCRSWNAVLPEEGETVSERRYDYWARRVLVLGGARSGKSERAETRVAAEAAVSYVATGPSGAGDAEWAARVAAHRARRPAWWRTIETTDLAGLLGAPRDDVLLIDGIGTWLAALLDQAALKVPELIAAWRTTPNRVVAVSDEAGLGVVPATASGRGFRDWLGRLNQALAAESEETELVVAGRVISLSE